FQLALVKTLPETWALHAWSTVAPSTVTSQPVSASDPAVTTRSAWNPPLHELTTLTSAVQSPVGSGSSSSSAAVVNEVEVVVAETSPVLSLRAWTATSYVVSGSRPVRSTIGEPSVDARTSPEAGSTTS